MSEVPESLEGVTVRTKLPEPPEGAGEEAILQYMRVSQRIEALKRGREDILEFARLMMPHPDDPDDITMSQYQVALHHEVMGHALHKVEKGELPRLIVCMPPRHGKTQLVSKLFLAWYMGRNPYNSTVLATYNKEFVGDFGREVRDYFDSEMFQAMFPEFSLRKGSKSAYRMVTKERGTSVFVGVGTALTGRGFHLGIIDDPFKDGEEAESQLIRDKRWDWFTKVFLTRQMTVGSSIIITLTRWHEDDIVGRLTDKTNQHYDAEEAARWKIINFPFFAEENDPLKRQPGEVLWPERFSKEFGEQQQRINPRAFNALYQQRPTAQEGAYFKKDWLQYYKDQPKKEELQIYAASDHAVSTGERNDKTCMIVAGLDKAGQIYLLDCVWGRFDAQQQVDHMMELMVKWEPRMWWSEKQHMGGAIAPFLRKRKLEQGVSCVVEEVHATKDKESRARSIQGLMADRRVWMPFRSWWRLAAEDELLKFPHGTYDDFVDAVAWLGVKIQQMYAARVIKAPDAPDRNTWGWWKKELAFQERQKRLSDSGGGW